MLKKLVITGCVEAILLTAAAVIDLDFFRTHAVWIILAASAVLILVALFESARSKGIADAAPRLAPAPQTTHGPQSSNFGTVHGNVTITHPTPAPTQERKSPYGSGSRARQYTSDNLEGLERAITGGHPAGLATYGQGRPRQCPGTPAWQAIHWIAKRIGEKNSAEGFPEARRQLRQAAREGLEIWGQEQIPPVERHDFHRHRTVWSPISETYWHDFMLAITAANEGQEDAPHTAEEASPNTPLGRYWNLKVHKGDIDRRWPAPFRRTDDDGEPGESWKTV